MTSTSLEDHRNLPSTVILPWNAPVVRATQPSRGDITLLSTSRLILKRRVIVLVTAGVILLAGLVVAFQPKHYKATGSIRVHPGSANMYNVSAEKILSGDSDDRIESEATVLQSKTLFLDVAKQLDLVHQPSFLGRTLPASATLEDPAVRQIVLTAMHKNISVERVPKTEVLNISCTSGSPLLSAKIVNALSNSYVDRLFQSSFSSTQRASKWLTGQLGDLKQSVENDQEQLVALQGRLGLVGFDGTHNLVASQLETLAKANAEANLQRIVAEARYRILQSSSPDLIEGGPMMLSQVGSYGNNGSSLLQSLRSSRAELATRFADLNTQFGPNYPDVKEVSAQLAEVEQQIKAEQNRVFTQAQVSYGAAKKNEDMTKASFNQQKEQALLKSDDMVKYEVLLHEYQVNRTLYEGLTERLREAGIVSGLASSEVDVVDMADVPFAPAGPGRAEMIGASIFFGLLGGVVAAFFVDSLDTSVGSASDLASSTGVPALAILPRVDPPSGIARHRPGTPWMTPPEVLAQPESAFAEGIQSLNTSLMLSRATRPPKTILVTSASKGEGKSTVATNLACVLARNGARVLLIDGDLRLPSIHERLHLRNQQGLSSVLTGSALFQDALQVTKEVPNLHVLTSGPHSVSASRLISSEAMRTVIAEGARQFDFVLVDSSPCSAVSDAIVLANMTEATILVVREAISKKSSITRALDSLTATGSQVSGFVMNGVSRYSSDHHACYADYGAYAKAARVQANLPSAGAGYGV